MVYAYNGLVFNYEVVMNKCVYNIFEIVIHFQINYFYFFKPDSIITNWLTWLSVSCEIGNEFLNFEGATPNASYVADLLKCTLKKGYGRILQESFRIFLPENPLNIFVDFLNDCVNLYFDPSLATTKLSEFESELKQRKNSAVIMDIDYEMMYMSNKTWIETTACGLLATTIEYNFTSQYNQLKFLKFLHHIDISKYFSIQVPDFQKFYNVLNYLCKSKCDIKLDLSVIFNDEIVKKELLSCVHELVFKKFYDCAFKIATIQGIDTDFIVVNEWEDKFVNDKHEKEFWQLCDHAFKEAGVSGNATVNFFERCSEKTTDKSEKYKILNLARKWAVFYNLNNVYEVERKMWIAYFDVDTRIIHCDFIRNKMLYAEMKQTLQSLENDCANDLSTLSDETVALLNKTIEKLLNAGDLWQSLRLSKIFKYETNDLEIINLCCNLAEGLLMPYQLNTEQRLLLNKNGNFRTLSHRRRRTLMSSRGFSSFSSASHSPSASTVIHLSDTVETPFQDTLIALETLVERVKNGVEIVQNILMTYRISVNIDKPYQEVFKCTNPMVMLKEALKDDCSNKLEVVHDFSMLFGWSKMQITDLLCEELITSISEHIKLKLDAMMLWNINLDTDFHLILQLLMENCSMLGLKLYSYASALHKSQNQLNSDFRISEINLVIELLIRSHDCFTADCNMEGISTILRKCQNIISLLLTLKSWKLIVRLLTGVARYTEMNYVFHLLRENDQFEFLLRKGSRKDNGLKVALLKYLKKYCPEERELYRMVALHFTLFSEIAQLWEEEARSIVRNLIAISKLEMQNNGLNVDTEPYVLLTNTDGTKICLNKSMVNYTHATEYHLQGEKLAKAMSSAKQAELLALQTSMLKGLASNSTAVCILNVSDAQIFSLISTELSFSQSLILVEACNYKADWATVLFEQFVINNHWNYLDGFLSSFPLTDTLINDISRKFLNLKAISDTTTRNMKEIINKCASVRTKYRIASELGFSDLVEDLLAGNQLAFLKDTVWKKGYKS
ncbi:hypothetical protein ILUMI_21411 [Ignelater luminosus]|uniref:Spatacsin C-terminal domain-containing protein n=1 Tax=Ignelater luminosus TaxID=2038154 RepID=A0A8K0CFN4_IGNLU|nr:hypothetical protein ILUMI_21411 [Ignelater luminosus]